MKRLLAFIVFFFAGVADAQTVQNTFGIQWNANNTMAVSTVGNARVRYNSVTNVLEVSYAGAAYAALGGGTLQQAYNAGGVGPQTITFDATRLGFVLVDANPTIGATLFAVRNNAQTIQYIKLNTIAGTNNMAFTTPSPTTNTGMIFNTVNDYTGAIAPPYVWNNVGNNLARLLVNSATQTEYDLFAGNSGAVQTQIITDTATTGLQVLIGSMPANTTGALFQTSVTDGASTVAFTFNSAATLLTNGERLVSVQNNGTEFFGFSGNGASSGPFSTLASRPTIFGDGLNAWITLSQNAGSAFGYSNNFFAANINIGGVELWTAGVQRWGVLGSGEFQPVADLTYPIGDVTHRPASVFAARYVSGAVAKPTTGTLGTNVTSITSSASSTDAWGELTVVTGGNTVADQSLGTIIFNNATGYPAAPVTVYVFPAEAVAATTANAQWYHGTIAQGSFQLKNHGILAAGTYVVGYSVGG